MKKRINKIWMVVGLIPAVLFLPTMGFSSSVCSTGQNCPRGAVCSVSTDCVEANSPQELATTKDQLGLTTDPGKGRGEEINEAENFGNNQTIAPAGEVGEEKGSAVAETEALEAIFNSDVQHAPLPSPGR